MSFSPQIFVSHSKRDLDIRTSFDTIFARTGVKSKCIEFEEIDFPSWRTIHDEINRAQAVFLLLGQNVTSSIFTQNWVSFEVGLSCAVNKDVWVFEQSGSFINFPVPFLTDYMEYNLNDSSHFDYVRNIIEGYGNPDSIFPLRVGYREKRGIPQGIPVFCGYMNCRSEYNLHTDLMRYNCPSCRRVLER